MTRFEQELSGRLGMFWKKSAEKLIQKTKEDIATGKITIDENGVARNEIGRVIMSDLEEVVSIIAPKGYSSEATREERKKETEKFLRDYRKRQEKQVMSAEEMNEMRNTFGKGTVVVDVLTGKQYRV